MKDDNNSVFSTELKAHLLSSICSSNFSNVIIPCNTCDTRFKITINILIIK